MPRYSSRYFGLSAMRSLFTFSELINYMLGSNPKVGIWYRVLIPKDGNPFFQIDRMGRPFVSTAFTKEGDRNTFNRIEPTEDRKLFTKKFSDLLESLDMALIVLRRRLSHFFQIYWTTIILALKVIQMVES